MAIPELKQIIHQTVALIPKGNVSSYGQIAKLCGYANHSRYVGTVLKQLPGDTSLPWHRVINGKGEISFPVGSSAYNKQFQLLTEEGVVFNNGKVPMGKYSWQGE